jgi:DNA repair ATPase RecN
MPDFSSKDSAMLEREISLLLGGVGTAFYVSIFGIFLSLWWIYFEKSGMSRFDKDIHAIKESVRHKFWTNEEIGQIHFQESLKNSEKLNNVFDKILTNDFINHMNDTLRQRLELFDNIINHEKTALKRATEHFNNLSKIADESENISFRIQDFTSQLQKSSRILSNIVEKLDNKERDVLDSVDELNRNISRLKNRDN